MWCCRHQNIDPASVLLYLPSAASQPSSETSPVLSRSGRVIKDIKWFFYFSTVFLLFVGAGARGNTTH